MATIGATIALANARTGTLLGQAQRYSVGEDRRLEIGWRKSSDLMPEYARRPDAYMKLSTTGRNVEKGRHNMTPAQLRKLATALTDYADILDDLQAAWDAEHGDR